MRKVLVKNLPRENGKPEIKINKTIKPIDREDANVEVEKGEAIVTDSMHSGFPEMYMAGGKSHAEGGTPLNLPENSFVFSHDKSMRIKDETIQKSFDKTFKKKGYTPAEIAKQYDINNYRKVLAENDSDKIQRDTAEQMIKNYNSKLGSLALVQESMKGFPDGIPFIAIPYLEQMGIDPAKLVGNGSQDEAEDPTQAEEDVDPKGQMKKGGQMNIRIKGLPKAQKGKQIPGFGSEENAQKFASSYPGVYNAYMQGLNSGDPAKMKEAANLIQNQQSQTPWYSLDAVPWSEADKFSDMSGILKERAQLLPYQQQAVVRDAARKAAPVKALGIYGHALKAYEAIPDSDYINKLNEGAKLKALEKYLPQYRMDVRDAKVQPDQYSDEELAQLDNLYNQAFIKPKLVNSKKAAVITQPTQSVQSSDTSYVETKNPYLKLGGGLDKFRKGGDKKPIKYNDGTVSQELADGSIVIKNAAGDILKNIPAPQTSQSPVINQPPNSNRKTGKDFVYSNDQLSNMIKLKELGYNVNVPGTVNDIQGAVDKVQGKLPNDVYGRKDWASPELFPDFQKRAAWYLKDHPEFDPKNKEDVLAFQQAYNKKLEGMGLQSELSPDSKFGEHTYSIYDLNKPESVLPLQLTKRQEIKQTAKDLSHPGFDTKQVDQNNPFWTEDIVNMAGAFGDQQRIKKYMPWQANYNTVLPEATYYDPTRELAANAEQANISAQALGAFAGPQALSSRLSSVQGQGLANAANILGKYNDLNVGIANQLNGSQTDTMNQANFNRANQATELYDKTVNVNQNFDNAKAMARQNLRQSFVNAWSNRGKTQSLNSINKQYQVDPTTGYTTSTGVGKDFNKESQMTDAMSLYNNIRNRPGMTDESAIKLFENIYGKSK